MTLNTRFCGKCMLVVGFPLLFWSVQAIAQSTAPTNGPSWEQWASIVISITILIAGAYMAGQSRRITNLEQELTQLKANHTATRELLFREYHSGDDLSKMLRAEFEPIRRDIDFSGAKLTRVHERIDQIVHALVKQGVKLSIKPEI